LVYFIRLRAALIGVFCSLCYKYLSALHVSVQLFKLTATDAGSFLGWHCAAVHTFSIYSLQVHCTKTRWTLFKVMLQYNIIQFHEPNPSVLLIMTMKLKTNNRFHAATILFYVVQKFALTKIAAVCILFRNITT
jgi:hypothetical protein